MVVMTAYQWDLLAEYLANVDLEPSDQVQISGDTTSITAHVLDRSGSVVDEVDIEADPSEGERDGAGQE
jgi:hypothetical protein